MATKLDSLHFYVEADSDTRKATVYSHDRRPMATITRDGTGWRLNDRGGKPIGGVFPSARECLRGVEDHFDL